MEIQSTRLYRWLDDRLPVAAVREAMLHKSVPVHRYSVIYYLGGMTLFLFGIQIVTGVLLLLYYRPSAAEAYESVEFIMTSVPFGWLIRSLHSWSANLMIFFALLHLVTVFFAKAYRPPREITWMSGVLTLFLALAFGFSGYLLPWNELAFFATKVGTQIAGAVPVVGDWTVRFLRGGDRVSGATLARFHAVHVAILPAVTLVLLGVHLLSVQLHGMSVPPAVKGEAERRRPMRFVPHYVLRDLFGWILVLGVLAALAAVFPWELGEKADPFAPAPADIRPEWYFMFMFQSLKLVPGGAVAGIEYEAFPIIGFGVGALVLLLVPFVDRRAARDARSPWLSAVGAAALVYVVAMTAWGYRSPVPIYAVLATGALMGVFAFVIRHREDE